MLSRILLVDDEQDFLESLERGLYLGGFHNILMESDPTKAAELIKQGDPIDIAIIDITMPKMSGVELLDIICLSVQREREEKRKSDSMAERRRNGASSTTISLC